MGESKIANNEKALEKLFEQCKLLDDNEIDLIQFIDNCEKILYNDTSSSAVQNFSDGWREGTATNIIKIVLKAHNGDEDALDRLKVDFSIKETNIVIEELK